VSRLYRPFLHQERRKAHDRSERSQELVSKKRARQLVSQLPQAPLCFRSHGRRAFQSRCDGRDQQIRMHGLQQIVVRAKIHSGPQVFRPAHPGQKDDGRYRRRGLPSEGAQYLVATHARHHDVAKDQVRVQGRGFPEAGCAVCCRPNLVALSAQNVGDDISHRLAVVDCQHPAHRLGP